MLNETHFSGLRLIYPEEITYLRWQNLDFLLWRVFTVTHKHHGILSCSVVRSLWCYCGELSGDVLLGVTHSHSLGSMWCVWLPVWIILPLAMT